MCMKLKTSRRINWYRTSERAGFLEPTWTKLKVGFFWPQLTVDLAVSSHQNSLQFKKTFGACRVPPLKFLPSGTMSKACRRTSGSSSTGWEDLGGDVRIPGRFVGVFKDFWGVQTFIPGCSEGEVIEASLSVCWDLWMGSLSGLVAIFEGKISLRATFSVFSVEKLLLYFPSSIETCKI